MKGGTKQGAAQAVETKREVYGEDVFAKFGAKGGQARNKSAKKHLTFKDKSKASAAGSLGAQKRWAKYREQKAREQHGTETRPSETPKAS